MRFRAEGAELSFRPGCYANESAAPSLRLSNCADDRVMNQSGLTCLLECNSSFTSAFEIGIPAVQPRNPAAGNGISPAMQKLIQRGGFRPMNTYLYGFHE